MKAWRAHEHGHFRDVLVREEIAAPIAPDNGVVIRVAAVGLNFPDILVIAGQYQVRPSLPFIPGMEASGHVISVGPKSRFRVGQRVIANGLWGCCAEQVATPDHHTFPIPDSMDDLDAAAIHVIYQTSYVGLINRTHLKAGETLLVHGGSGGVGTSAIQLGKALGARVIATASSPEKVAVCHQAGADDVINYHDEDFVTATNSMTQGAGADVIYDPVGGDVFTKSTKCIAFGGRLLVVGFASGHIPTIATNRILLKNISVVGLHWGNYYSQAPDVVQSTHQELCSLYKEQKIKPVISDKFGTLELPLALTQIAERKSTGKLVLRVEQ